MQWTKEQQSAIDCREEKSILLAAAAGSGKTAVLVERIISKIKDKENPLSVSELLVLTFTEAAASEMKRKIMTAIKKALEEEPENEHLRKQSILIHSASISTVHAFCNKLLKGHIHMTDLPADYSLATETEVRLLLKQAVDEVLEKYYARLSRLSSFAELCSAYGDAKGDSPFRKLLSELYLFSLSLPYPYEWLKSSVRTYKAVAAEGSIKNTPWQGLKEKEENAVIDDLNSCYAAILSALSDLPQDHKYVGFYQAEADLIKELTDRYKKGDATAVREFHFPSKVRKCGTHPTEEKTADDLRELAKDSMLTLQSLEKSAAKEAAELSKSLYLRAKTLKNIVIAIDRKFSKLKREKALLDFSDLEHGLLGLISDRHHNPTDLALDLRKRYTEILLDEYQDTNNIQEEIFRLISRDSKNIFMVGDLKQSIYKFRNAVPELFANKRKAYASTSDAGKLISLRKNFRSRSEVIGAANFMFSSLMTEALGDIDYTEEEFLIKGAAYPEPESESESGSDFDFETEYYVIKKPDTAMPPTNIVGDGVLDVPPPDSHPDMPPLPKGGRATQWRGDTGRGTAEGGGGIPLNETEAHLIANKINEMVGAMDVYDTKTEKSRKAEYRDIVILLRGRANAPLIESVLEEHSIPVYSDTGKGYLSSPEVETVLSFLNIIDNPYQDIPLIAVLRSKIFGFTPDELAKIRLEKQGCWFYDALVASAEAGFEKAKSFIAQLEALRKEALNASIYKLILTIYERYNYVAIAGLMSFPAQRRANLKLLAQRAMDFERSSAGSLFGFMNYLEKLKEEQKDLTPAKVISEGENVVRIMTIHKSKGLEFPIVFLSDTAHKFNLSDSARAINFHAEAGLSLAAIDTENRIKYPSFSASLFKAVQKREFLSEEMRLLYVALTRAKEKLIITSPMGHFASRMKSPLYDGDKKPLAPHLKRCQTFADWISASLLVHPAARVLREFYGYDEDIVSTKADFKLKVHLVSEADITTPDMPPDSPPLPPLPPLPKGGRATQWRGDTVRGTTEGGGGIYNGDDAHIVPHPSLFHILSYSPASADKIPVKITVSELKRRLSEDSEYTPRLLSSKNIYLKKKEELSAAEKGTITHFVLQHLNEREINSEADLISAIDKAEAKGVISAAQRSAVSTDKLMSFFESDLGKRLKESKEAHKEYSFYSSVTAGEIYEDLEEDSKEKPVLLQGTIDCFFMEQDGRIILLDYKTDNITKDEAEERAKSYKVQIDCYNKALKDIFGRGADESYIYFLSCAAAVKM